MHNLLAQPARKQKVKNAVLKQEVPRHDDVYFYKFIGESYAHEMMDGQALQIRVDGFLPDHAFELR